MRAMKSDRVSDIHFHVGAHTYHQNKVKPFRPVRDDCTLSGRPSFRRPSCNRHLKVPV